MLRGLAVAFVKDLRLLARDRAALVFLTIAPVIVITVAGLSLASLYGAGPKGTTAYRLPFVDEDRGEIGGAFRKALETIDVVKLEPTDGRERARSLVVGKRAGVALVIPAAATEAVARGEEIELVLFTDPVKYLEIASVRGLIHEIRHRIEAAAWARAAKRVSLERERALAARPPGVGLPEFPSAALPGAIGLREESVTGAPQRLNTFDQNVPGFSVTFLLLGMLFGVSLGLLDERDWGTLERVRTAPTPFAAILIAKLLSRFVVGVVQMLALFAVGWIAFGVSLGPEPPALLLPILGIAFAGTALGLVVAGVARSRDSVLPVGSIVIVTMAAAGGCWWPIDLEPEWMRSAALAFPTTWAMAAFNDLMIRRQPVAAALEPTAVLVAYGTVYLVAGLALFRRHL